MFNLRKEIVGCDFGFVCEFIAEKYTPQYETQVIDLRDLLLRSGNLSKASEVVEYLFHITRKQMAQFMEIYGREYYGDRWGSRELKQKIDSLLKIKIGLSITRNFRSAILYLPFLRGRKFN